MIYLLDINVLLALVDTEQIRHERTHSWVKGQGASFQWATCVLTENGFCRILGSPSYPVPSGEAAIKAPDAAHLLRKLRIGLGTHVFWICDFSLTDEEVFEWELIQGPKQLTDIYLVALAARYGGKFVTLDQRIRWRAVKSASAEVVEAL